MRRFGELPGRFAFAPVAAGIVSRCHRLIANKRQLFAISEVLESARAR